MTDNANFLGDDRGTVPIALITASWLKYPNVVKAFSVEQRQLISGLFDEVISRFDRDIDKLDGKLRNHRHDFGKTFSAKPEF